MKIDAGKIVQETIAAFENSGADKLYLSCKDKVEEKQYKELHPQFLTPTSIKINADQFNKEILPNLTRFFQWGKNHTHLPRWGAALVNENGMTLPDDPINGSLMEWNLQKGARPILETDCRTPTDLMDLPSLQPLSALNGHWCRSNVLFWDKDAMFVPHIDTIVPSMWIRLWAAMSSDVVVRCAKDGELVPVDFEVGRVYIIDTSIVHDAYATDKVHQLFLSVMPSAVTTLRSLLLQSE